MGTDCKYLADSARSRNNIYGLLATVFREEPSEAFIRELKGPHLSEIFSELGVELGDAFYMFPDAIAMEILGLEFTRLFIGPEGHISAHESVFTQKDGGSSGLWGTRTVEVKNFIETTGLDYEPTFTGIPDHISVELEFMHKLAEWEAEKWEHEDQEQALYCQKVQRMFLEQHLLCWLPEFCDEVIAHAKIPFYQAMADLCRSYIEFERHSFVSDSAA